MGDQAVKSPTSFYDLLPELKYEANNQPQDNSNPASFYESFVSSFYSAFGLVKRHDWDTTNTVIFSYEEKVRMHLALLETFDSSSPYYKEILENFIEILKSRVSKGSEYSIDEYKKQLENLKKREKNPVNQSDELSQNSINLTPEENEEKEDESNKSDESSYSYSELPSLLSSGLYETSVLLADWNHIRFLFLYMKSEIEASLNALKDLKLDKMISQINPYTAAMGVVYYGPRLLYNTGKSLYHRIVDGDFHYFNINRETCFNDFRWIIINALSFALCPGILGAVLASIGYGLDTSSCFTSASNKLAVTQNLLGYVQSKISNQKQDQDQEQKQKDAKKALTDIQTAIGSQYEYHNIDQKRQNILSGMVFAGSLLGLFHFVSAPVVSAILMLGSCAWLYYHNHSYLPQLKVQTHHNPLGLLYDKLITYTEAEIKRLKESLENIEIYELETATSSNIIKNDHEKKNENITTSQLDKSKSGTAKLETDNAYLSDYKSKTEKKLEKYDEAHKELIAWAKSKERNPEELKNAMKAVEDASKIHRRENSVLFAPKSRSSLETIVKPFLAQWSNNKNTTEDQEQSIKDQERSIKTQITEFTESRISKSIVSSTKEIFYNYSQEMSSLFCPLL